MKLAMHFRSVIATFSQALASELDQLIAHLNRWSSAEHLPSGAHGDISVTGFTFSGDTQTTVGAAGGASALPATPSGYFTVTIAGTAYVVPFYAQS
jgi:hypothetical protein